MDGLWFGMRNPYRSQKIWLSPFGRGSRGDIDRILPQFSQELWSNSNISNKILKNEAFSWTRYKVETQCGWKPPAAICLYLLSIRNFFCNDFVWVQSFTSTQAATCRELQLSLVFQSLLEGSYNPLLLFFQGTPFINFQIGSMNINWSSSTCEFPKQPFQSIKEPTSHNAVTRSAITVI